MDRRQDEPLNLSQAKLLALQAADDLSLAELIRRRPWVSVGVSAALGYALGRSPALTREVMELALRALEDYQSD